MILPTKRFSFVVCLLAIVLIQNGYTQQQIAQDTYAIFEKSCLICHGPDGAYRETFLMEHSLLIANGTVVLGNPNASELYKRLLTTGIAKRMPLDQPRSSVQAIDTIRNWILAGPPIGSQPPPQPMPTSSPLLKDCSCEPSHAVPRETAGRMLYQHN